MFGAVVDKGMILAEYVLWNVVSKGRNKISDRQQENGCTKKFEYFHLSTPRHVVILRDEC